MKRNMLILMAAVALAVFWPGLGVAGEYHQGAQLICSDCHTMHASVSHDYSGGGSAVTYGAVDYLLKVGSGEGTNDLCLSCHNATSNIPDVYAGDTNSTPSGGRQAGALNKDGDSGNWADYKGHSLGNVGVPPGGSGSITLTCVGCHNQHGTTYYRNLKTDISYTTSTTASNTDDVRINLASVPAVGSRVSEGFYSFDNIFFNEVATDDSPYGDLCASCHSNFHGTTNTGSSSAFQRHPTEAVNFTSDIVTQYNGKTNNVQVMMASNSGQNADTTTSPSCMSCHKAHGNKNPFGLIYMASSGTVTEQGVDAGGLRDLCGQCHSYGN